MGAFDHLNDDDPRVIEHEKRELHANCGPRLEDIDTKSLLKELQRRINKASGKEVNKLRTKLAKTERDLKQLQNSIDDLASRTK